LAVRRNRVWGGATLLSASGTSGILPTAMHLKTHRRKKDGQEHRYFSVVENRRLRLCTTWPARTPGSVSELPSLAKCGDRQHRPRGAESAPWDFEALPAAVVHPGVLG
jgi:hypothetical protein